MPIARQWHNVNGIEVPKTATSLVATGKGKLELVKDFPTPWQIPECSSKHGRLHDVIVEIIAVGACPTDSSGIQGHFPGEDHMYPYSVGHEAVGVIKAIHSEETKNALAAGGMDIGSPVYFDINTGCGPQGGKAGGLEDICRNCNKGAPPFDCIAPVWAGIAATLLGQKWYKEQTGKQVPVPPGAYTEGFMTIPPENVYRLNSNFLINKERWAMATQIDAIACAHSTMAVGNIHGFAEYKGFDDPNVLVIGGAGRVTFNHLTVLKSILPNSNIYLADLDQDRLETAALQLGIHEDRLYHITHIENAYTRVNIIKGFEAFQKGEEAVFDIIFDFSTGDNIDGTLYEEMIKEGTVSKGSVWLTGKHTGYPSAIRMGTMEMGIGSHAYGLGISPRAYIRNTAAQFLYNHADAYEGTFNVLEGGLQNPDLIEIVRDGGGPKKAEMDWGTLMTYIRDPPPLLAN